MGAVIIEAPSMFQARVTAVVQRLAPGGPFGEGLKLSAKMMTAISPEVTVVSLMVSVVVPVTAAPIVKVPDVAVKLIALAAVESVTGPEVVMAPVLFTAAAREST